MKRGGVFAVAVVAAFSTGVFAGELTERIAQRHKVTRTDAFAGGRRTVFDFDGYEAWVVEPPEGVCPAEGRPWTWTMQWATAFVPRTPVSKLLARGWHHVTINTFKHRMDEAGLEVSRKFQAYLVDDLGFSKKAGLIGLSWGGFFSTRYAARCPQNVEKIFLDCPLLNLGGRCGRPAGEADIGSWARCKPENWIDDPRMPINLARSIAEAKIPILLRYGGADNVLEPALNSEIFIPRFKSAGGEIKVIHQPAYAHHPHGFEESDMTAADFFLGR